MKHITNSICTWESAPSKKLYPAGVRPDAANYVVYFALG